MFPYAFGEPLGEGFGEGLGLGPICCGGVVTLAANVPSGEASSASELAARFIMGSVYSLISLQVSINHTPFLFLIHSKFEQISGWSAIHQL